MSLLRALAVCTLILVPVAMPATADEAEDLVLEGMALHREGRYADARSRYDGALAIDPDRLSAINNRGVALIELGDLEAAYADFSRALQLGADNGAIWNNRANVNCALKRVEEAVSDRMRALYFGRFTAAQAQVGLRNNGFYNGLTDGVWGFESDQAMLDWTRAGCPRAPATRLITPR